jgi:diguanylate cyclase (GGDEF)-like protein/PAS domain S-box-containing protein
VLYNISKKEGGEVEKELFLAIITNGILLLSMGILYTFLPLEKSKNRRYYEILIGALLSLVVLLLMSTTFTISADKGVVLDTRSILLSISTFFFGLIPGLIAAVVASIYRIILGGGGTLTGVLVIVSSFLIGYLFRHLYYDKVKNTKLKREIILYILGLITHITMMILFLFLPKDVRIDVITTTAPYVLIIYPIIGVLFGTLIFQRQDNIKRNEQKIDYLEQFQHAIKNAPIPMMIQQEDGQIILFSKAWLTLSGYEEEEINTLEKWVKNVYPKEKHEETLNKINKLFSINEPFYEGEFTIKAKNGEPLIWDFYSSKIGTINDNQTAVLSIANDVTSRIKLEDELRTLSFKDELTGLYNRRFYEEEIRRLNTLRNYPITLLLGDVNHLKEVNDNYGHIEGDNLLKTVAKALKDSCREDDIIARMGGDEFIMILPKTNKEDADKIIERLYIELEKYSIQDIKVSVSFGQSTLDSSQTNVEEAFIHAEDAMYIKKEEFNKKGK